MSEEAAPPANGTADETVPEVELSDNDILDAMQHIPGYVDISTGDFREVYHLAHHHAIDRLLGDLRAENLMRAVATPLAPAIMLDEAARTLVASGFKALPVVDGENRVIGMLTETDFLRQLKAGAFLELLLMMIDGTCELSHCCHETTVRDAMTTPAVTVRPEAGFREMMAGFRRHAGRSMPVADVDGRLRGLLIRKDFLEVLDREAHR